MTNFASHQFSPDANTMDAYQETFETWNKVAALYQDKFMHLDLYDETYDFVCDAIAKNKAAILELGCGPGNITRYLLSKRPDFNLLGLDVAPNMVELARKNNPSARFAVMDCRDISAIRETFDGVVCGFILPYFSQQDAEKLLDDVAGLLNEQGLVYISFVEGDPGDSGFQSGSSGDRCYFYYHELETLKTMLLDRAFCDLKTFHVKYRRSETQSEVHTILMARKSNI